MAYKITEWEYSNVVEKASIPVEEGARFVQIKDANFIPETKEYHISTEDLTSGAEINLRYWLTSTDKNGNITSNAQASGTLISLGKSLFGAPVGIPAPCDIIGGVVIAEVVLKESATSGAKFPRVFKFRPATKEVVETYSTIEQYSEE